MSANDGEKYTTTTSHIKNHILLLSPFPLEVPEQFMEQTNNLDDMHHIIEEPGEGKQGYI